ncbi:response regulator [Ideonella sp. A 288]|uniref:response regulator n=1 Tax=Ideonella sp. A 288 TaxID=1962181 RepID=UPI000B4B900F|nr:response regulator [Ideonella sp. A 288]
MLIDRDIDQAHALVIDGNPTSRSVMSAQLRDLGVGHIKQTGRVNDARLLLERRPYDIVLCDYHFESSAMSGQDLLDELRRENLLPHATVFIMVTGEATYAKIVEAAESALDSYLLKPYTAASLGERLMEARRRKRMLKDIFEALERQDNERALRLCIHRFSQRESYWQFCGRVAAELMLKLNRSSDARRIYEAVAKEKAQPWARLGIARAQLAGGEVVPARRTIEALLTDHPQHADAYDVLGRVHVDQGDFGQALLTYRNAAQLTPGCLLRLQHCGTLAFYQGEHAEALRMLERTMAMGLRSKLFDALTLMLLALLRHDSGDTKGLAAVREQIRRYAERHAGSTRLQRFDDATAALLALQGRDAQNATDTARAMAASYEAEGFDLEAATVVLALWSRLPPVSSGTEDMALVGRHIGMRFCVSKAVTEMLVAATGHHEVLEPTIRACHAEITGMAEQAMSFSLRGEPRLAVQTLLQQGTDTLNAKLIEMAGLVAQRHAETIEDSAHLLTETTSLQRRFCHPITHLAGVRRTGRSPGGLLLRR